MPQVTRTTNDAIIHALYLIGELGVGETPDAFMLTTGLELINELLDQLSTDSIYIPYLTTLNFTMVPGQDTYSISDMVTANIDADRIVDLTFVNYSVVTSSPQTIVYPVRIIDKAGYYNIVRVQNLQARPGFVFLNKQPTESFITFYPAPDQPYPCTLQVKCMINDLDAQDDLSQLAPYYYAFLKYAIARKFLAYYPSANWPQTNEDEYQRIFADLKESNENDLTVRPSDILDAPIPFYWPNILTY